MIILKCNTFPSLISHKPGTSVGDDDYRLQLMVKMQWLYQPFPLLINHSHCWQHPRVLYYCDQIKFTITVGTKRLPLRWLTMWDKCIQYFDQKSMWLWQNRFDLHIIHNFKLWVNIHGGNITSDLSVMFLSCSPPPCYIYALIGKVDLHCFKNYCHSEKTGIWY